MLIQKEASDGIFSGDSVTLKAHTLHQLEAEDTLVQARYIDKGSWQTFRILSRGGRSIFSGDTIFLAAHNGNLVDVEGRSVRARYQAHGEGPLLSEDTVFVKAHTGKYLDVEGEAVMARFTDRGTSQSLLVERRQARILNTDPGSLQQHAAGSTCGSLLALVGASVLMLLFGVASQKLRRYRTKVSSTIYPDFSSCDTNLESRFDFL
jgi:hypothetical protein